MKTLKIYISALLLMVCSAVNAQNAEPYLNVEVKSGVYKSYPVTTNLKVSWGDAKEIELTGKAKALINNQVVEVTWFRLWAGGPKFAEYNVGVTDGKATSYGYMLTFGGTVSGAGGQKNGASLTGTNDSATNLWGPNWRMPTRVELQNLLNNCDISWVDNYNGSGVNGRLCKGRGIYAVNSIFLPAGGYYTVYSNGTRSITNRGNYTNYWSSTWGGGSGSSSKAYYLDNIANTSKSVSARINNSLTQTNRSVRAVLAEDAQTSPYLNVELGDGSYKSFSVTKDLKTSYGEKQEIKGTTKAIINTSVVEAPWVQLWEGGPKFATYNVGAANNQPEDYGLYYCWGGSIDKDSNHAYNNSTNPLTGTDDTATKFWGPNWRMPTSAEYQGLISNCTRTATTVNGVAGVRYTGKIAPYNSNSIFLPKAGNFSTASELQQQAQAGYYWTNECYGASATLADALLAERGLMSSGLSKAYGFSVRAVVNETTGTAKNSEGKEVRWVQLWAGGPKFAEYNVGVTDGKPWSDGGYYTWGGTKNKTNDFVAKTADLNSTQDTATKLWGENWRMPTNAELQELMTKCDYEWVTNYQNSGKAGLVFTGKEAPYKTQSMFLPGAGQYNTASSQLNNTTVRCSYYSSTYVTPDAAGGAYGAYCLLYTDAPAMSSYKSAQSMSRSVRAVLK